MTATKGRPGAKKATTRRTVPSTATKRAYQSVKITMPKWYFDALAAEADRFRWSRGQLLEFLVLRARGEVQVKRNPDWPQLKEPRDPGPNEPYLWNCPRLVMDDIDRIKHASVSYSMWLYFMFREWLGHPVTLTASR
jgi:hypothetical protein